MNELNPHVSASEPTVAPSARRYPDDFKRDAVRLAVDEKYTFRAAAQAVGVSEKSRRDWHAKFAPKTKPSRRPFPILWHQEPQDSRRQPIEYLLVVRAQLYVCLKAFPGLAVNCCE